MSSSENQAYAPAALLNEAQWQQLNQAISSLDSNQMLWVSGYLAGLAQAGSVNQSASATVAEAPQNAAKLTILFGSQTGNAKGVAQEYKTKAEAMGFNVELFNMADYKVRQLKNETHLLIVVSTHGEGDAPDDAIELHEFLSSKKAPKLDKLKYAVLGLGDSSYEFFCQTAKDFDQRLAKLGASSVLERLDADVDYETDVANWHEQLTAKLKNEFQQTDTHQVLTMPGVNLASVKSEYSKKHPFTANLIESQKITGRESVKDIRHIEISLEGSGIQYQPGDALGVWFTNDANMVDELLNLLSIDNAAIVSVDDTELTVREALIDKFELTQSYAGFVIAYADVLQNDDLTKLIADKAKLRAYLAERQIIDVVRDFPTSLSAEQLLTGLRKISPRLYSIASSQDEVEEEVHLTVALVEYEAYGHLHQGGASGFLSQRLEADGDLRVFVEHNNNFRLPEDNNTPVIMIGPGTGIAPFRAFMQQREAEDAQGKSWLFFGNPNYTQDFLYQVEWQSFVKSGVLDKVSLAFSRDQEQKIYVQHRMLEQGEEFYQWLEQGAHVYVCGDANRMAKDVNDAMLTILEQHGNKSREEAEKYINELRRAKRYQKDVY